MIKMTTKNYSFIVKRRVCHTLRIERNLLTTFSIPSGEIFAVMLMTYTCAYFFYFDHSISDSDADKILLPFILGWRRVYSNRMRIKQRCYLYPEISSLFISPCNAKSVIFKEISWIGTSSISCQIAIRITQWVWVTHIFVKKLTTIGSDNCLSPGRCQAIIWITAGIKPFETNVSQIFIFFYLYNFIQENAFENVVWKMAAILSRPQCVNAAF